MAASMTSLKGQMKYKIPQIKLCLVQEGPKLQEPFTIKTPQDAAQFFDPLKLAPEEHFVSLHLNARHEVIGLHEVSHGTVSSSLVHPREVFKAAILSNSYAIVVCHNHPSGSRLFASDEDINTTEHLLKAANLLGVELLDHLIVSREQEAFSIRENHPKLWAKSPNTALL
ncbi:MAG: JAB domain-containing protein [Candidatus Obscuribacterales bacterium]|nr:JAB domain-containing protein [Candidatus Obscuribacterales bacterium]